MLANLQKIIIYSKLLYDSDLAWFGSVHPLLYPVDSTERDGALDDDSR